MDLVRVKWICMSCTRSNMYLKAMLSNLFTKFLRQLPQLLQSNSRFEMSMKTPIVQWYSWLPATIMLVAIGHSNNVLGFTVYNRNHKTTYSGLHKLIITKHNT